MLLNFSLAVDGDENVEGVFSIKEKFPVLAALPTHVRHSPDGVFRESGVDARVDAFV